MKYLVLFASIFIITTTANAQYEIRAGMGIDFAYTPSLNDYLLLYSGQKNSFNSAVNFSGEFGYRLNDHYQIGLDMGYLINSFNYNLSVGNYQFSYNIIAPTIMNYYVIRGVGYKFKFGGGIGPRFTSASENLPAFPGSIKYTTTGFGLMLRAEGGTILSGNLYASIGGDLKYDFNGELKNGGKNLVNNGSNVNLDSFSVGVRLGVMYLF